MLVCLVATLSIALMLSVVACDAAAEFLPTPTILPAVRDYQRLSTAQIAEHYQRCLKRVDQDHPDLSNTTAVQLAKYYGLDRAVLQQLDQDCMVQYDRLFSRPPPTPTPTP